MHRARFADEASAKLLEHLVDRDERLPYPACAEPAAPFASAARIRYQRVFLDEGETLARMLEEVRHAAPHFVSQLLERLKGGEQIGPMSLPEPLSKSELEILRLLNHGATNQEIASKLGTTVGTIKWHLNQIFGKMQVHNRTGALAKARQLKLL